MTNDILEQVVEDYFRSQGYFTQHNIKYRPAIKEPKYAVHSDIDILAYNPLKKARDRARVAVASCKSWQGGLEIPGTLKALQKTPNRKWPTKRLGNFLEKSWIRTGRKLEKQK